MQDFHQELERRLRENKKLYQDSGFGVMDTSWVRFVASYLGVNPWKVFVPVSMVAALVGRAVFGKAFTEYVLRVLGG